MNPEAAPLSVPAAILRRRATRKFDPSRPIPDDLLNQILSLATHAPSAFNLQPWRFLLVRSEKNRQKLRACAFNQPKVTEAPIMVIVLGYHNPHLTHLEPMLAEQVARGVVTKEAAAEIRGRVAASMNNVKDKPFWVLRSTMIAATALMLAAESLGVSSAPMEGFDPEKVREAFGVPDDHTVCCLVALGYAAEAKPFPGRFGLDDVCFEEHFGRPRTGGRDDTAAG